MAKSRRYEGKGESTIFGGFGRANKPLKTDYFVGFLIAPMGNCVESPRFSGFLLSCIFVLFCRGWNLAKM